MSRSVGVPPPAEGCPSLAEAGSDGPPSCELLGELGLPELGLPELWDGEPEGGGLLDGLLDGLLGGLLDGLLGGLEDGLEGGALLGVDGGVGRLGVGRVTQAPTVKAVPVITRILSIPISRRIAASIYLMESKPGHASLNSSIYL